MQLSCAIPGEFQTGNRANRRGMKDARGGAETDQTNGDARHEITMVALAP
jgi:hypothetical protein